VVLNLAEQVSRWTDHERIVFLLEAARQFGGTLDEQKLYTALQHLIADAMPLDGLIVSSFTHATGQINCEYIWADGKSLDVSSFPPIQWKPDGTGMQGKVILTGVAEVFDVGAKVRDPKTSYVQVTPDGGPAPVKEEPAAKTAMMAPMLLEGQVTGVVQAMSDRPNAYGGDDLKVFEAVVLQMTAAWHHSRLYKKSEEDRHLIDRIVGACPDLVYIYDIVAGKSTFSNGKLARALGFDPQELDVLGLEGILHADDVPKLLEHWAKFDHLADGETIETDYRLMSKGGDWRWFLSRDTPFERDADGKVVRILGFARDITAQKQADSALRESEERYRLLAEAGPYLVWSALPDGEVDYVSESWSKYFGKDKDSYSHEERSRLIHDDDRDRTLASYASAISTGKEFECEYRLLRFDGMHRWFLCRAAPIRGDDGNVLRWFGILFDIHDQKQTEEDLSRRVALRTKELEAAVKELEGFTYSVSHDLRGPLRAISAASMILREDYGDSLPQEAQDHLLRQAEAAKRMSVLIDDLLKLSRIGRQELTPENFDLSAMALEVAEELQVVDRVQIEPGIQAHGDPRLVRFVLLNLIENAVKFSPDGGNVRVGSSEQGYFVADEGIGFEMEYAPKIFRPFERLVRNDEYPGTGIGLANAQRIVQRHGGTIWAESEPGKGSTFWFTLPIGGTA
jgi:PAS domain S-box-containing protein